MPLTVAHENYEDSELDWIALRQDLEAEREKDIITPPYKQSLLLKLGVAGTVLSFGYTLLNMNNPRKMFQGMSSRVAFQFLSIMFVGVGYYNYTKLPECNNNVNKER